MYLCTYVCVYMYICVYMYLRTYVCMCVYIYIYVCVYVCVCVYVYICMLCVRVRARVCVYMHVFTYVCLYVCAYVRILLQPSAVAAIAQSVQRNAKGWTVQRSNPGAGGESFLTVHTDHNAHDRYKIGTGLLTGLTPPECSANHGLLAPRLRMGGSIFLSPRWAWPAQAYHGVAFTLTLRSEVPQKLVQGNRLMLRQVWEMTSSPGTLEINQ
jgi:nuclear pore complex protein Nup62